MFLPFALLARKMVPLARWACVWWVPTCIAIYTKNQMIGGDGLAITARAVGKIEVVKGDNVDWLASFTLLEQLSFYRGELLWGLLILPALSLLLTSGPKASRWRGTILAVASILLSCLLYAELLSLRAVGRMLSMTLASDALTFADCCAPTAREYFGFRGAVQLGLLALLAVALAWWAGRQNRNKDFVSVGGAGTLGLWGTGFVVLIIAWLPWLPSVPYHTSVLETAVKTFAFEKGLDTTAYAGLTPEELTLRYRQLTHTPIPREDSRYWGKAKDCDVLIFVLETAPALCLSIDGDLSDCPNLAHLRERAFVASRHHATYPYTSRAVFSILSSWYPSTLMKGFPQRYPDHIYPGLMQSLKAVGYHTAVYAPDAFTYRGDDNMYKNLGIERRIYIENEEKQGSRAAPLSAESDAQRRLRLDRDCLQALKTDMHAWHQNGRKFAALYLPQIGHAPWLDFTNGADPSDTIARGRKLISMQDAWMGEILNQLAADGKLEQTLIVVVGDHGIRTRREDPNFRPGMVDEYSFHVPLLIYAPPALAERANAQNITSHIDVAPTLLDLLGIRIGRESEQGVPIWDERIKDRNIYFPANHLLGSDGYCSSDGRFCMWNHLNEAVYENTRLHFDTDCLISKGSDRYQEITNHMKSVYALLEVWGSRCCCPNRDVPKATETFANLGN